MEFHDRFKTHVPKVNEMAGHDEDIASALDDYAGERFVLSVKGDATYIFDITPDGLEYDAHEGFDEDLIRDGDMLARMDMKRARKLVEKQTLGVLDIPHIEHRNIGMQDVNFAKTLFKEKS